MFKSIVVGTDGSDRASEAVLAAAELAATQPQAVLHIVTHEASAGSVRAAAAALAHLPEVHGEPDVIRVVAERG